MPKNVTSGKNAGGQPSSEPASTLSRLIRERGISYTALANSIGTTRQTVSNYASGAISPPSDMLVKIADYFGVTTDYLLGRTTCSTDTRDKRAACDYTGLSEEAVENLLKLRDTSQSHGIKMLSFILEREPYIDFLLKLTAMYEDVADLRRLIHKATEPLSNDYWDLNGFGLDIDLTYEHLTFTSSQAHLASLCFSEDIYKANRELARAKKASIFIADYLDRGLREGFITGPVDSDFAEDYSFDEEDSGSYASFDEDGQEGEDE